MKYIRSNSENECKCKKKSGQFVTDTTERPSLHLLTYMKPFLVAEYYTHTHKNTL